MLSITKTFSFNAAHRLQNYQWLCSNVHGHNFVVSLTLQGDIQPTGMVFDFKDMKPIQERIDTHRDHAFLYEKTDPIGTYLTDQWLKTYLFDWPPTTENICLELIKQLENQLDRAQMIYRINIQETAKCSGSWVRI